MWAVSHWVHAQEPSRGTSYATIDTRSLIPAPALRPCDQTTDWNREEPRRFRQFARHQCEHLHGHAERLSSPTADNPVIPSHNEYD